MELQACLHALHAAGAARDAAGFDGAFFALEARAWVADDDHRTDLALLAARRRLLSPPTLDAAVACGSAAVVRALLAAGEEGGLRARPAHLLTALQAPAATRGALLGALTRGPCGVGVNAAFPEDGRTLLHHAVETCREPATIRLLLQLGASVRAVGWDGVTPAEAAAHANNAAALRALHAAGMDLHGAATAALEALAGTALRCLLRECGVRLPPGAAVRGRPILSWLVDAAPRFALAPGEDAGGLGGGAKCGGGGAEPITPLAPQPPSHAWACEPARPHHPAGQAPPSPASTAEWDSPVALGRASPSASASASSASCCSLSPLPPLALRPERPPGAPPPPHPSCAAAAGFAVLDEFALDPATLGACASHVDALGWLLDAGLHPAAAEPSTGWTPLHVACHRHDAPAAALLLQAGASPLAAAPDGALPHELVARGGAPARAPAHTFLAAYASAVAASPAAGAATAAGVLPAVRAAAEAAATAAAAAAVAGRIRAHPTMGRPGLTALDMLRASRLQPARPPSWGAPQRAF